MRSPASSINKNNKEGQHLATKQRKLSRNLNRFSQKFKRAFSPKQKIKEEMQIKQNVNTEKLSPGLVTPFDYGRASEDFVTSDGDYTKENKSVNFTNTKLSVENDRKKDITTSSDAQISQTSNTAEAMLPTLRINVMSPSRTTSNNSSPESGASSSSSNHSNNEIPQNSSENNHEIAFPHSNSNPKITPNKSRLRKNISWMDQVPDSFGTNSNNNGNNFKEEKNEQNSYEEIADENLRKNDNSIMNGNGSGRSILKKEQGLEYDFSNDEYFKDIYNFNETDEEFFYRTLNDWDLQDNLTKTHPSWISQTFWMPVLLVLKAVNFSVNSFKKLANIKSNDQNEIQTKSLNMNMEQKKEAAMVLLCLMLLPLILVMFGLTFFLVIFPLTSIPTIIYLVFIFRYDKSHETGKRVPFMRYYSVWRHFVNYFPIRLVKTYNLDPDNKYLMAYHPHGIISLGAFGNFATDATGFSRLFPGIDLRLMTLNINFFVPFLREFLLSMGLCSCSKRGCNGVLRRGPGSAIMLVVGGADESLYASPGTYRLNVNSRKGFVRVALDNNAYLVPVLGFGENDVFSTKTFGKDSVVGSLQEEFKQRFGFATPVFWGQDIGGILPHRTPVIAVVGKPLKPPVIPNHLKGDKLRTTKEGRAIVNEFHAKYIHALKTLYDHFKSKWNINTLENLKFTRENSINDAN